MLNKNKKLIAELDFKTLNQFQSDLAEYQNVSSLGDFPLAATVLQDFFLVMESQGNEYVRLPASKTKLFRDVIFHFKKRENGVYEYLSCEVL